MSATISSNATAPQQHLDTITAEFEVRRAEANARRAAEKEALAASELAAAPQRLAARNEIVKALSAQPSGAILTVCGGGPQGTLAAEMVKHYGAAGFQPQRITDRLAARSPASSITHLVSTLNGFRRADKTTFIFCDLTDTRFNNKFVTWVRVLQELKERKDFTDLRVCVFLPKEQRASAFHQVINL